MARRDLKLQNGSGTRTITNRIAIILGLLIIGFLAFDMVSYDWQVTLFLGRKFIALSELIAFWR